MEYYAYSKTYSCTKQLPRIKQPVLLVYGQKDRPSTDMRRCSIMAAR